MTAELERFKEIFKSEMEPVMAKLKTKFEELLASNSFISKPYDHPACEAVEVHKREDCFLKKAVSMKETKKDMESNMSLLSEVNDEIDEMAWLPGNFVRRI